MTNNFNFNHWTTEIVKFLKDIHIDKLFQQKEKVRVAITGLSKSGKTIFIISLINQLISGKRIEKIMRKRGKRFIANIVKSENDGTPQFNYFSMLENLRVRNPKWPQSTSSISKITLQLEVKSDSLFLPNKIIELEITDYPGEWLFDIEMANLTFDEWSEKVALQFRNPLKRELAKEWQDELHNLDIYGFSDGSEDEKIIELYKDYLKTLDTIGLSIIQLGRFINNQHSEKHPLLFTPLPTPKFITPHENSVYTRFKKQYELYVERVVKPLAIDYFSNFDRQIILVDVLKSLQKGYNSFVDMADAIRELISIYQYGHRSFLKPILERKIDKVLFGATKADYIPFNQHNKYKKLLDMVVEEAKIKLDIRSIDTETVVLASVVGDRKNINWQQSDIPETFPKKEEWRDKVFTFPNIPPVPFPDRNIDAVEHINVDEVIDYLIGDKL